MIAGWWIGEALDVHTDTYKKYLEEAGTHYEVLIGPHDCRK